VPSARTSSLRRASALRRWARGPAEVYVCDRFGVAALTPGEQRQIADGRLLLDHMTRSLIREHLGYRYAIHPDGTNVLAAERAVRVGGCTPASQRVLVIGDRVLDAGRQSGCGDLEWPGWPEQLSACAAAAPVALVFTGPLGGVLRGYSWPRLQRAGVLPPLP
jgi:hypothetical protein